MALYKSNKLTHWIETNFSGRLRYSDSMLCYILNIGWGEIFIRSEGVFFSATEKNIPAHSILNISETMQLIGEYLRDNGYVD